MDSITIRPNSCRRYTSILIPDRDWLLHTDGTILDRMGIGRDTIIDLEGHIVDGITVLDEVGGDSSELAFLVGERLSVSVDWVWVFFDVSFEAGTLALVQGEGECGWGFEGGGEDQDYGVVADDVGANVAGAGLEAAVSIGGEAHVGAEVGAEDFGI